MNFARILGLTQLMASFLRWFVLAGQAHMKVDIVIIFTRIYSVFFSTLNNPNLGVNPSVRVREWVWITHENESTFFLLVFFNNQYKIKKGFPNYEFAWYFTPKYASNL